MIDVTLFGDSHTDGSLPWEYGGALFSRLDHRLTATTFTPWTSVVNPNALLIGHGYRFYNAGLSADTTAGMRARFAVDVLGHHTDRLVILGGTNDIEQNRPVANIMADLTWCIDQAHANGIAVVHLGTVPPYNKAGVTAAQKNAVDALNVLIRAYCVANPTVILSEFFAPLEYPDGSQLSPFYTDGVHVNEAGAHMMAQAVNLAGWESFSAVTPSTIAGVSGCVADWRVEAGGAYRDRITRAAATVTGNNGLLPNVRTSSLLRGALADFDATVSVSHATTGWNPAAGAVFGVLLPAWSLTDGARHDLFYLPGTNSTMNAIGLYKDTDNKLKGSFGGADGTRVFPSATPTGTWQNAVRIVAMRWKSNEVKVYDCTGGASNAVATEAADMIGCAISVGSTLGTYRIGGMQRFVVFNVAPTDAEMAAIGAELATGVKPPVAPRLIAGKFI